MGIKVEVSETINARVSFDFPVLMVGKDTGRIVLFHNENSGTIIKGANAGFPIETRWPCTSAATIWERFEGTLTLSNE